MYLHWELKRIYSSLLNKIKHWFHALYHIHSNLMIYIQNMRPEIMFPLVDLDPFDFEMQSLETDLVAIT